VAHGDKVEKGQTLAKLFAKDRAALLDVEAKSLESAFAISGEAPSVHRLIIEEIQ
jgi:thymidine phosphorylase